MTRLMLVLFACALAAPLRAQSPDAKAVRSYVEDFLTRLGDGQYDTLDADFTPKALIVVVRQRNGAWTTNSQTAEEWLASLKKNPDPPKFREAITNVNTTIDSDRLAYMRADFTVTEQGKTLSSGVDQFTLVREGERWRMAVIAYTSIPAR